MKKILFALIIFSIFISVCAKQKTAAIPNPWIECGDDISCASKKAGFNFPLKVKNYSVRAMEDMIEITFPLDKKRIVTARKSSTGKERCDKETSICDISGVYEEYPVNKIIKLKNGVNFLVKGKKKNNYNVVSFVSESGYYSFYSKNTMKLKDIEYFYKILEEAEAPRNNFDETDNYSIEKLMDLRRTDGIVEPVYTQDCFPRTLEKMGVTADCFERANLGQDSACSASQVKMIKEYYKKGQQNDPLNDGSGKFCAD